MYFTKTKFFVWGTIILLAFVTILCIVIKRNKNNKEKFKGTDACKQQCHRDCYSICFTEHPEAYRMLDYGGDVDLGSLDSDNPIAALTINQCVAACQKENERCIENCEDTTCTSRCS